MIFFGYTDLALGFLGKWRSWAGDLRCADLGVVPEIYRDYGVGAMFVLECGSVFLRQAILGRFSGKVVMLRKRFGY